MIEAFFLIGLCVPNPVKVSLEAELEKGNHSFLLRSLFKR